MPTIPPSARSPGSCASGWPRRRSADPEASRQRHLERGKLLPRERVDRLLDDGSPFLDVAPLAAEGMYGGDCPGAGLIAGIGLVHGRHVMVVCNDATVKGGTYYPLTVKMRDLGHRAGVELPITEAVYRVCYQHLPPTAMVPMLMTRPYTPE